MARTIVKGKVNIRKAKAADANAIAWVSIKSWRSAYRGIIPDEVLENLSFERRAQYWTEVLGLREGSEFVYVAEKPKGNVIGFASGGRERLGDTDYVGEVYAIYLLEENQGQGIGRLLLQAAAKRLIEIGLPSMLIWVLEENPARGFYEAMGGEYLYEKEIQIGNAKLIEVAYGWKEIKRSGRLWEAR